MILLACSHMKAQTSYSLYTKPMYGLSNSTSIKMHLPYFALLPKLKYEFGSISSVNLGLSWMDYLGDEVVDIPSSAPSGVKVMSFEEFVDAGDTKAFPEVPPTPDTTAVIMYTSGSTGEFV